MSSNPKYSVNDLFAETYGIQLGNSTTFRITGAGDYTYETITEASTFSEVLAKLNKSLNRNHKIEATLNTDTGRIVMTSTVTGLTCDYDILAEDETTVLWSTKTNN